MVNPSLPSLDLLQQQADWLAPARARLLRRIQVARRRSVLDLGCGWQAVTAELARRSSGTVVAVDIEPSVFSKRVNNEKSYHAVCGDAARLPFRSDSFDLVFCQFSLLWFDVDRAIGEIRRVLAAGGLLVALEPDYGGLIEYPDEIATAGLWQTALQHAGADPLVGRHLPEILDRYGFTVRVDLLDRLAPPSPLRFDLLRELPLTADEIDRLDTIEAADAECTESQRVVHLPIFLVTATSPLTK